MVCRLADHQITSYNANGLVRHMTDRDAILTTQYTYDRLNSQTQVSSTSTDENGQPVVIASSVTYTWDGKVKTSTDASGNVSSNVYDTRGLLTKTIDAYGNTTAHYYDNAGRLVAVVSALNYDPLTALDQMSRTEYAYDLMGRVKTVTQTYYDNQTSQWVSFVEKAYQYDSLGNVTKELGAIGYASGTGTTVDDRINTGDGILYFYNLGGKLTLKLTSNTEPTQYTYDALGRVTSKSNERGVKTGYTYDGVGKLLTEKVYTAHFPKNRRCISIRTIFWDRYSPRPTGTEIPQPIPTMRSEKSVRRLLPETPPYRRLPRTVSTIHPETFPTCGHPPAKKRRIPTIIRDISCPRRKVPRTELAPSPHLCAMTKTATYGS